MSDAQTTGNFSDQDGLSERPESHQNGNPQSIISVSSLYVNPQYLSGGRKSLSGISIRAYSLGIALGFCSLLSAELAYFGYGVWRAPFFVVTLSIFHYLEFDMTARYNPSDARVSSFLLLSNGMAYTTANAAAMTEVLIRYWLCSEYKPSWLKAPFSIPLLLPTVPSAIPVCSGILFIVVGQCVRSAAMKTAKANFNHIVQSTKKDDHVLITTGVYAFSRHPSYFGFFWWGLGTQLVLGNRICFIIYTVVLWKFFAHRIMHEEGHLVSFFGHSYQEYRRKTPVRIPFIW